MLSRKRFSLRTLFLATTFLAVVLGLIAYERLVVTRQMQAIAEIQRLGGVPNLVDYRNHIAYTVTPTQKPRFTFVNYFFGAGYYIYAPQIILTAPTLSSDKVRAMIPHLEQLRMVEGMNEANKTNVALMLSPALFADSDLVNEIKQWLPQSEVIKASPNSSNAYQ